MKKVESMQHPASEGRAKAVVLSAMMLAVTAIAARRSFVDRLVVVDIAPRMSESATDEFAGIGSVDALRAARDEEWPA